MAMNTTQSLHQCSAIIRFLTAKSRDLRYTVIDPWSRSELPYSKLTTIKDIQRYTADLTGDNDALSAVNRQLLNLIVQRKYKVKRLQNLIHEILDFNYEMIKELQLINTEVEKELMFQEEARCWSLNRQLPS